MSVRHTSLRRITAVGAVSVAAATLLGAAPAAAAGADTVYARGSRTAEFRVQQDWLDDPNVVPGPRTARVHEFEDGTAQVRYGVHQGVRYGWGRALNAGADHWIRFEVDLDGDRSWDEYEAWRIGARHYTSAYPTSPSPDRAFRACIVAEHSDDCVTGGNGTTWW